ncbi:MAG: hypothetical protein K6T31_03160, partial [Alicyclobacillus sp.]|nr:hypothetical protein [Alicyclobacillus sp.]
MCTQSPSPDTSRRLPADSSAHRGQGSCKELARVFLWLGLTTFGGMWGANASTEKALIERRHWMEHE